MFIQQTVSVVCSIKKQIHYPNGNLVSSKQNETTQT